MGRFSRWSRMKSDARAKRGAALPGAVVEEPTERTVNDLKEASEETPLDTLREDESPKDQEVAEVDPSHTEESEEPYPEDLPPIESLNKESDYTVFMSNNVSEAIRNQALRKLWRSDPVLANLDGLIDYGEDFTDAATVIPGMKSVYKVGRGMVDYEEEERKKAEKLAAAEAEAEPEAEAEDLEEQGDIEPGEAGEDAEETDDKTGEEDAPAVT